MMCVEGGNNKQAIQKGIEDNRHHPSDFGLLTIMTV